MKKNVEAQNSAIRKTSEYLHNNSGKWAGNQPVTDTLTVVDGNITLIDQNTSKMELTLTGYATDKQNKRILCMNDLLILCGGIKSYAIVANMPQLYDLVNYPPSKLEQGRDTLFLAAADIIIGAATDNLANLAPYNVKQPQIDNAQKSRDNYAAVISMPKDQIAERSAARQAAEQLISDTMLLMKNRLDSNMLAFRTSDPDFYNGYQASRKIDDPPKRHRAIQGKVTVSDSGAPVSNVTIQSSAEVPEKKSGAKGNFFYQTHPVGTYNITFSKAGFQSVTKSVNVIDGERTEVDITLQAAA